MSESRSAYEEKLDAQLKEWSSQIGLLKARAKLHELTSAGDEAWDDLKAGAEKAWSDVRKYLHDAMSRFT